jgi:sialate O-acetylesterase
VLIGSTGVFKDSVDEFGDGMNKVELGETYKQLRSYNIPDGVLKFGEVNTIAVRVYDGFIDGGIYEGPVGIIRQSKYQEYWSERKESGSFIEGIIER